MPDVIKDGNAVQSPVSQSQMQQQPFQMPQTQMMYAPDQFISPVNMMAGNGTGMPLAPAGANYSPQLSSSNILPNAR